MKAQKLWNLKPVSRSKGEKAYTDEELIEYLIGFKKRLGRIPAIGEIKKDPDAPSFKIWYTRGPKSYTGWCKKVFGEILNRVGNNRISDERLVMYLREYYNEFGKTPTQRDIDLATGYPSGGLFSKRGGMQKFLELAGLPVNKVGKYQDDELIEILIALSKQIGKTPTSGDLAKAHKDNPGKWPCCDAYFSRNTWFNWLQKSGLKKQPYKYTEEQLEEALKKAGDIFNRAPTSKEFDALKGFPPSFHYMKRGGWLNWLDRCGLKYTPTNNFFGVKITTKDGHNVRSSEEAQIDDWLFDNNFVHSYEPFYPGQKKYRADFLVKGIYYEYVGLEGKYVKYDAKTEKKVDYAKQNNIQLVLIRREDLDDLSKIFI